MAFLRFVSLVLDRRMRSRFAGYDPGYKIPAGVNQYMRLYAALNQ